MTQVVDMKKKTAIKKVSKRKKAEENRDTERKSFPIYGWIGIAITALLTMCVLASYQSSYTYAGRHGVDVYLAVVLSLGGYIGRFVMEGVGFSVVGLLFALLSVGLSFLGAVKRHRRVRDTLLSLLFFTAVLMTGGLVDGLVGLPPGGLGGRLGAILASNLSHAVHPLFVIGLAAVLWVILLSMLFRGWIARLARIHHASASVTARREDNKKRPADPVGNNDLVQGKDTTAAVITAKPLSEVVRMCRQSLERRFDFSMPQAGKVILHEEMPACHVEQDMLDTITGVFDDLNVRFAISDARPGPVVTVVDIMPQKGQRVRDIRGVLDDLTVALGAKVRLADAQARRAVSLEVSNAVRHTVPLGALCDTGLDEAMRGQGLFLPLGVRTGGEPFWADVTRMPHLLVAGETGSGKSVFLNALIVTAATLYHPSRLRMVMVDPKRVELAVFSGLPHLLHPVITDTGMTQDLLEWLCEEMEERYRRLEKAGVRDVTSYRGNMPLILAIVDEFADLLMASGQAVEDLLVTLAQKSRAVGIHVIMATQRPSAKVVTGLIKANVPARIAFRTASAIDSRIILDEGGAESLVGNGDMLLRHPKDSTLVRLQGAFVSDAAREKVVKKLGALRG